MTIKPATPPPFHIGEYISPDLTDAWIEGDRRLYERGLYDANQVKVAVLEQWIGDKEAVEADQNAAYIVHACNNYPKLVEALKACVSAHFADGVQKMRGAALLRELGEIE